MTTYEYIDDGGDTMECESCGWEAPLAEFDHPDVRQRGTKVQICEVCASTACGNPLMMYRDDGGIFRAIAQTTNLVLDKATGRKPPTGDNTP